jgi:hypothetical protein
MEMDMQGPDDMSGDPQMQLFPMDDRGRGGKTDFG